jgi:hypothetical protein
MIHRNDCNRIEAVCDGSSATFWLLISNNVQTERAAQFANGASQSRSKATLKGASYLRRLAATQPVPR